MSTIPSKSLLHELVNNKYTSNYDLQINAIEQSKPFEEYKDQYELYNDYINCKQKTDPIICEANFWKDSISKIESLQPEFIVYWLDKYHNAHPKVKEELQNLINVEETILQIFSDSITNIFRQDENISAKYTAVDDVDFESTIPNPLTPVIQDKLNLNYQSNVLNSSTKVNSLFNQNINKIYNGSSQTTSHQSNLTTDYHHIQRLVESKPELLEIVADHMGNLYEVLSYISNYKLNNLQNITPIKFNNNIEGENVEVDILGNKVQKDKNYNTKDLLGD